MLERLTKLLSTITGTAYKLLKVSRNATLNFGVLSRIYCFNYLVKNFFIVLLVISAELLGHHHCLIKTAILIRFTTRLPATTYCATYWNCCVETKSSNRNFCVYRNFCVDWFGLILIRLIGLLHSAYIHRLTWNCFADLLNEDLLELY